MGPSAPAFAGVSALTSDHRFSVIRPSLWQAASARGAQALNCRGPARSHRCFHRSPHRCSPRLESKVKKEYPEIVCGSLLGRELEWRSVWSCVGEDGSAGKEYSTGRESCLPWGKMICRWEGPEKCHMKPLVWLVNVSSGYVHMCGLSSDLFFLDCLENGWFSNILIMIHPQEQIASGIEKAPHSPDMGNPYSILPYCLPTVVFSRNCPENLAV